MMKMELTLNVYLIHSEVSENVAFASFLKCDVGYDFFAYF